MLSIICGTNRPESNSEKVARNYGAYLREQGEEFVLLNLEHLPEDFAFKALFGKKMDAMDAVIEKHIVPFDKFIFIVPEYNGSYPGVLKTFLDAVPPKHFHDKKAALVGLSDGVAGNLRGLDDLTNVLNYLKVDVLARKPKLSKISEVLNADGSFSDERCSSILQEQIEYFLKF